MVEVKRWLLRRVADLGFWLSSPKKMIRMGERESVRGLRKDIGWKLFHFSMRA